MGWEAGWDTGSGTPPSRRCVHSCAINLPGPFSPQDTQEPQRLVLMRVISAQFCDWRTGMY